MDVIISFIFLSNFVIKTKMFGFVNQTNTIMGEWSSGVILFTIVRTG